jgi:hypothetical protein
MLTWIAENLASILLLLVVAVIVFFIIKKKIKDRKQGMCSCGCEHCSGCASHQKGGKI